MDTDGKETVLIGHRRERLRQDSLDTDGKETEIIVHRQERMRQESVNTDVKELDNNHWTQTGKN